MKGVLLLVLVSVVVQGFPLGSLEHQAAWYHQFARNLVESVAQHVLDMPEMRNLDETLFESGRQSGQHIDDVIRQIKARHPELADDYAEMVKMQLHKQQRENVSRYLGDMYEKLVAFIRQVLDFLNNMEDKSFFGNEFHRGVYGILEKIILRWYEQLVVKIRNLLDFLNLWDGPENIDLDITGLKDAMEKIKVKIDEMEKDLVARRVKLENQPTPF